MVTPFDIIAMGCVAMDYYLILEATPWQDEKVKAQSASILPGGTMGNFACAAAKLGAKTGFVGIVGDDLWGDSLIRDFKRLGVDATRVVKRSGQNTPLTVLILDQGGRRANILPPFPSLRLEEIDMDYLLDTKILHTHLFDGEIFKYVAIEARKKKIILSTDLELQRIKQIPSGELKGFLSLSDLVFLNQETLAWIAPSKDIETAANSLREAGPKAVVITMGAEGRFVATPNESICTAPFRVKALDATGAGDAFAGAFCYGWLQGWPLRKIMEFASSASALVVIQLGARTGLSNLEEVFKFIEEYDQTFDSHQSRPNDLTQFK